MMRSIFTLRFFAGWLAVAGLLVAAETEKPENSLSPLLVIYHTNDVHGHAFAENADEKTPARWGYERLAALVEMDNAPRKLLLDAGDFLQGNALAMLRRGELIARILTLIGYDALAVGNHEFDYGVARVLELRDRYRLPMLSANVRRKNDGAPVFAPYLVKNFADFKVGILGLTTPLTANSTDPHHVESLAFGDSDSLFADTTAIVKQLRDREKVDLIIALTHLGSEPYCQPSSLQLADAVDGIDLIIDGHSHSEIIGGKRVKNTLIASAGEYLNRIGKIKIDRAPNADNPQNLPAKFIFTAELLSVPENAVSANANFANPELRAALEKLQAIADTELNRLALTLPLPLDGDRSRVRTRQTDFGRILAAAMARAAGTPIAIINSGSIRESLARGENSFYALFSALPYENEIVAITVSGEQLCAALNYGLSRPGSGAFPQFYGLSMPAISAAEKLTPEKIQLANGEKIRAAQNYEIAITDFLRAGGDGYEMFKTPDFADTNFAARQIGELRESFRAFIATQSIAQLTALAASVAPSENP